METKNTVENYYDSVAKAYDKLYVDNISQAENRIVKDWFLETIRQSGGKVKIVDIGCGTGLGLEFLMKELPERMFEYVGIDISSEMITMANKKFGNKPNAVFLHADIADLTKIFKDNSVDIVTSFFGSFSHVPKFLDGMKKINQVLKPNGKIFLMVYSRYSFRAIFDYLFRRKKDALKIRQEYNIRNNGTRVSCKAIFYSPCFVKRLLEKSNFSKIKCKGLNFFFEVGPFKFLLRRFNVGFVKKVLEWESFWFRNNPRYAHSLVAIAEKNEFL